MTALAIAFVVVGLGACVVLGLSMRFVLVEARRLDATADACKEVSRACELRAESVEKAHGLLRDELTRLSNRIATR